jgi:hypothetical protein
VDLERHGGTFRRSGIGATRRRRRPGSSGLFAATGGPRSGVPGAGHRQPRSIVLVAAEGHTDLAQKPERRHAAGQHEYLVVGQDDGPGRPLVVVKKSKPFQMVQPTSPATASVKTARTTWWILD